MCHGVGFTKHVKLYFRTVHEKNKCFAIPTKSFVKIGITKIFFTTTKCLVQSTKCLVAAAKFLVEEPKNLFVVPNFVAVTKPFFSVYENVQPERRRSVQTQSALIYR